MADIRKIGGGNCHRSPERRAGNRARSRGLAAPDPAETLRTAWEVAVLRVSSSAIPPNARSGRWARGNSEIYLGNMWASLQRMLAGREASLRQDIMNKVVERSGYQVRGHTVDSLALDIGAPRSDVQRAVQHLEARHALIAGPSEITTTPEGRDLARDLVLLQEGRNEQHAWYMAFSGRLGLLATAIAIASAIFQWRTTVQQRDRIDRIEQRIERMAIPAPLDSLPTTGR